MSFSSKFGSSVVAACLALSTTSTLADTDFLSSDPNKQTTELLTESNFKETESVKQEKALEEKKLPGYKIVFHKSSTKKPELANKKVRGQLYKHNNPFKRFEVKTDDMGEIHFTKDHGKNLAVSLYYIEGEEKLKVRCQGNALPGKKEIEVKCQ